MKNITELFITEAKNDSWDKSNASAKKPNAVYADKFRELTGLSDIKISKKSQDGSMPIVLVNSKDYTKLGDIYNSIIDVKDKLYNELGAQYFYIQVFDILLNNQENKNTVNKYFNEYGL